ncbi:DNA methyltransferase [Clostridium sp. E02]|uniref:DNA methyltransferase n=1 Tax=Clostridium sp. E02 TaxID=2487134 RepID=UPI0013DE3571|nr:DNA methyltransferase [Clostridium sp. E02]
MSSTAEQLSVVWEDLNLDYEGENKYASFFSSNGNMHTYPAKAVPEMVSELIKKVQSIYPVKRILDPFVGSGTTALEAKYLGLDFWGSDLNPLAVLLTKTKSLTIENTNYTKKRILDFLKQLNLEYADTKLVPIVRFEGIDFWFKEKNIKELEYIKHKIDTFIKNSNKTKREMYALILLTAYSSTVRKVSLTRNGEFKLYRMSPNDIEKFSISAIETYDESVKNLLNMLVVANDSYKNNTICNVFVKNAKNLDYLEDKSIDLVITSPPYGDSKTTVAYGEFSKLSVLWMKDLMEKYTGIVSSTANCDEILLGGRKSEWEINDKLFLSSDNLTNLLDEIDYQITISKNDLLNALHALDEIKLLIEKKQWVSEELLSGNKLLYQLVCERIRLDIYRKVNSNISGLSDKKIKKIAKENMASYMNELCNPMSRKYSRRQYALKEKLVGVDEAIHRKMKSIEKRKNDVIVFLKDLYKVVIETDRVLCDGGYQVWIVGHRTVMGKIVINMEGIINDWFQNMNYHCEASLNRKYSFKRMPFHINSTIERCEEIQTMMNEYILVVKKN